MKDSKVVKEYDVKGANPFATVFTQRERGFWEKFSLFFSSKLYAIEIWYHHTKRYFKNLVLFNKVAKNYYPWDYQSQVDLFAFGLEHLANFIDKKGNEVDWSRNKKVAAIRELVNLLKNGYQDEVNDKYLGVGEENVITHITEYEDGSIGFATIDEESQKKQEKSRKRYEKELKKAHKAYFDRIFYLIKGQDLLNKFGERKEDETLEQYYKRFDKFKEENFDGSGIEGWWD